MGRQVSQWLSAWCRLISAIADEFLERTIYRSGPTGDIRAHAQLWRANPFQFFSSASPLQFNAHVVWFRKSRQVNPAMKDMALKSMEMAKVSMKNNKMDECVTQMKAASDAMKK